ncbi:cyclopentanol dehydrogenase-like [Teleopsis dalmanni]|uniref:cyclopentanol dehydrogenase-like n=1 Tax=Teleopsis dalmanni TaxID=139649 RepID=UPI0018CD0D62|nr:cyclopentanol dehydrogenase-like [Teleopsis dalmanni]
MTKDISRYVKSCQKCQKSKIHNHTKIPMTITDTPTGSFDTVLVDTIGPLPKTENGNEYAVTLICDLTKYLVAIPIPNKSANTVAKRKYSSIIGVHYTSVLVQQSPKSHTIPKSPDTMSEVLIVVKYLDVLVNAAGIIETGSIENTNLEQFDRLMNTNVRSVYQLTMLAVPELIKTKGNIVNISSVCGLRAFPNVLAYNISKTAIDQFTRCVALELAAKGVRCNSVNPGVIATELHKRGGMDETAYAKFLEHCKTTHALGRAGEVHEVSGVICFLASEKASFITGVNMPVDGGRHAMCPR